MSDLSDTSNSAIKTVNGAETANVGNGYEQRSFFFNGNSMGKIFASDMFFNMNDWTAKTYFHEDNDNPETATPYYLVSSKLINNDHVDKVNDTFKNFIICTAIFHKKINNIDNVDNVDNVDTKLLWNNVYAKWNSLDEYTKLFYDKFMKQNNESPIYNIGYATDNHIIIDTDKFSDIIPKLSNDDTLQKLYNDNVADSSENIDKCTKDNFDKSFNKLIDKIVKKRLAYIRDDTSKATSELKTIDDKATKIENNQIEIKAEITNKWKNNNNNTYSFGDKEVKNIPDTKCYTTGIQTDGENKTACNEYVMKCLTSADKIDVDACKLTDKDFFEASKSNINDMHPLIALRTLEKFGFKKIKIYDASAKKELIKIQSFKGWESNAHDDTKMLPAEKLKIINNYKLKTYLIMVVTHVNSNPQILNNDYIGISQEKDAGKLSSRVATPSKNRVTHMLQHRQPLIDVENIIRTQKMFEHTVKVIEEDNNDETPNSTFLAKEYDDIREELQSKGKNISDGNIKSINLMLKRMQELEKESIKTIRYIVSYNNMHKITGDIEGSKIMSLSNLKSMIEHNKKMHEKYKIEENSIMQIFMALNELVNDAYNANVTEVHG
jgi:hypothetical protein